jgi:hypothetical protein
VVQLPTTLMACVDSSIGGKTAVNVQQGHAQLKNIIGTFHPPSRVYIDIACIAALPPRQFNNGMAEIIKCAILASPPLYALLASTSPAVIQSHHTTLARVMYCLLPLFLRIIMTPCAYPLPSTSKQLLSQRTRLRYRSGLHPALDAPTFGFNCCAQITGVRELLNLGHTVCAPLAYKLILRIDLRHVPVRWATRSKQHARSCCMGSA